MPPTTLTLPTSERCGAADLEEAPKDSQDELGPEVQDGACDPQPCCETALLLAAAFGGVWPEHCPNATSRIVGPCGAPMPSLAEPTRLTIAPTKRNVNDDGPRVLCHMW